MERHSRITALLLSLQLTACGRLSANLQQSYVRLKPSGPLFTAKLCKSEKEHGVYPKHWAQRHLRWHFTINSPQHTFINTQYGKKSETESLWSTQIFTFVSGPIRLCLMNKHETFLLRKQWKYAVLERSGTIYMKITNTGKEPVHTFSFIVSHWRPYFYLVIYTYLHTILS